MNTVNVRDVVIDSLEDVGILIETYSDEDINLTQYEVDSLSFIAFIVDMEEKLDISIPDSFLMMEVLQSLNGFVSLIEQLVNEKKS